MCLSENTVITNVVDNVPKATTKSKEQTQAEKRQARRTKELAGLLSCGGVLTSTIASTAVRTDKSVCIQFFLIPFLTLYTVVGKSKHKCSTTKSMFEFFNII